MAPQQEALRTRKQLLSARHTGCWVAEHSAGGSGAFGKPMAARPTPIVTSIHVDCMDPGVVLRAASDPGMRMLGERFGCKVLGATPAFGTRAANSN